MYADTGLMADSNAIVLGQADSARSDPRCPETTEVIIGPAVAPTAAELSHRLLAGSVTCRPTIAAFVQVLPSLGDC
jgi:hypothetical protein